MDQIVLYGIGGADTQYVAIEYMIIPVRNDRPIIKSLRNLKAYSMMMKLENPTIKHVYAIKNRKGLAWDYRESIRERKNSIEARFAFRDILEREGVLID